MLPEAKSWLEARHTVAYQPELADDPSALRKAIYKTQALLISPKVKVGPEFLDFAPCLRVVARMHDNADNIDLESCRERKIRVIQPTSANVRANAEFLLGGLLMLARRGYGTTMFGSRRPADAKIGRELNGSVVGVLGLAPAAHALSVPLNAMGVRLIGYDPAVHHTSPIWDRLGIQPVTLHELLATADSVSVQIMYASRYRGFINDKVLAHCKPGQAWVAVGRSALFDEAALAAALSDGRIEACIIDGADAPFGGDRSPLASAGNLMLTPRLASQTRESRLRASWYVADRMHEYIAAATPPPVSSFDPLMSQPMDLELPYKEPVTWGAGQASL